MTQQVFEFTVTRQHRWHDGLYIVEITQGGLDFSGPDMLVEKYGKLGEGDTFKGMTPAVEAAVAIARQWKLDLKAEGKNYKVYIASGNNHGMGLTLDEYTATEKHFKMFLEKAKAFDEKLPKCVECGEILGKEHFGFYDLGEFDCCSEYCAEKYYAPLMEEVEE